MFLNIVTFFLLQVLCLSNVSCNFFSIKKIENFKLMIENKNLDLKIPKDILLLNNKNKYSLYIDKLNNNKINNIDIFPYFVFK